MPGLEYGHEENREMSATAMNRKCLELNPGEGRQFFILGAQRSGTTMLRLMLDRHSRIAVPFESFVLIDFFRRLSDYGDLENKENRLCLLKDLLNSKGIGEWNPKVSQDMIDIDQCRTYADLVAAVYTAYARLEGKAIWGDKTPEYTLDFDVLNKLFPRCRFVHLIRDGRDVALSLAKMPWGKPDFISALEYWREVVGWARKMGRMLPSGRYIETRYEDLVMQPEASLERICSFLELDFEQSMLDFSPGADCNKMPGRSKQFHKNLCGGLNPQLVHRWQTDLCRADQGLAWGIAGKLLGSLEYPMGCADVCAVAKCLRRGIHFSRRTTTIFLNKSRANSWKMRQESVCDPALIKWV